MVDDDGIWTEVRRRATPEGEARPALFLDRDGTIVEEVGYLCRADDVRPITGAARVISAANRRDIAVVLVSNQSGIGRGLYGWEAFAEVQAALLRALAARGAVIDAVFACPFHAEADPPHRHPDHPDRKPNPGMLLRAAALLPIDPARSWIVGDRASDIEAGRRAGLAGGVLVATGFGGKAEERTAALRPDGRSRFDVRSAASIADVLAIVPLFGGEHHF
jgi:D-glycero-D-manno-heptose 1,7-bisphosphate phosphatase